MADPNAPTKTQPSPPRQRRKRECCFRSCDWEMDLDAIPVGLHNMWIEQHMKERHTELIFLLYGLVTP